MHFGEWGGGVVVIYLNDSHFCYCLHQDPSLCVEDKAIGYLLLVQVGHIIVVYYGMQWSYNFFFFPFKGDVIHSIPKRDNN